MKVVVTTKDFCEEAKRYLESEGFEVALRNRLGIGAGAPDDVLYPVVEDADAIIAGTETYRPELLARLRNLKLICRNGIGYDAINLDALRKEGIGLTRTKGFVEGAVAEQVMAYILYFARRVDLQSADMHDHCWNSRLMPGAKNHTLGLVGFGGIGTEVAKRAVPFGMKVIYFCRHPNPADDAAYGVQSVSMEELLKESDYVVAAVPLTDQTFHLFNEERIAQMKAGLVLINIARGPVVDEEALAQALASGHLGGCAVDVFPKEPCTNSVLTRYANALLTPHSATSTAENSKATNFAAANNLVNYLKKDIDAKYVVVQGTRY